MVGEVQIPIGRASKLAIIYGITAADLGALCINPAASVILQVRAATVDQQKPSVIIPENFDVFVRDLPQQMTEVTFTARCDNLLRNVMAALRSSTIAAFVLAPKLNYRPPGKTKSAGTSTFRSHESTVVQSFFFYPHPAYQKVDRLIFQQL